MKAIVICGTLLHVSTGPRVPLISKLLSTSVALTLPERVPAQPHLCISPLDRKRNMRTSENPKAQMDYGKEKKSQLLPRTPACSNAKLPTQLRQVLCALLPPMVRQCPRPF